MNSSTFGHPNDQISFLLSVHEEEGNALGLLTPKDRITIDPEAIIDSNWTLLYGDALFALESLLPFWLRPLRNLLWALF